MFRPGSRVLVHIAWVSSSVSHGSGLMAQCSLTWSSLGGGVTGFPIAQLAGVGGHDLPSSVRGDGTRLHTGGHFDSIVGDDRRIATPREAPVSACSRAT